MEFLSNNLESNIATKKNIKKVFTLNYVFLILEIIALYLSIKAYGLYALVFYTNLSNYFALVCSLILCIGCIVCLKQKRPLPRFFYTLKFLSNVCLTITFLVCWLLLVPAKPDIFSFMLYQNANVFYHVICPILSVVGFFTVEKGVEFSKKIIFIATIPTLIYGIVLSILNLKKIVEGPYPFFVYYAYPLWFCLPCVFGIYLLSAFISFI